jgi:hypothetical protein
VKRTNANRNASALTTELSRVLQVNKSFRWPHSTVGLQHAFAALHKSTRRIEEPLIVSELEVKWLVRNVQSGSCGDLKVLPKVLHKKFNKDNHERKDIL